MLAMADKNETPLELDWVTERHNCDLYRKFTQLRREIENDIKKRNELITEQQKHNHYSFGLETNETDTFTVHRNGADIVSLVQFRIEGKMIAARDAKGALLVEASLTLNDQGRCMLLLGNKELENWCFRRRALEIFFFEYS